MSLQVIETLNNDLSAYIATNVISITDGQLYLDLGLFGTGQCPAVSLDKSVSRVGAKSLDSLSRSSAFQLYAVVGQFKQGRELHEVRMVLVTIFFQVSKIPGAPNTTLFHEQISFATTPTRHPYWRVD